jgi:adenylate cyclase
MPLPDLSNFFNRLPRFGDLLRNYRTLRGLTVEQLAEAAGLAPSAIRDMEAGKRAAPPADVTNALADALRLSKQDRSGFMGAAELDSPMIHALTGRAQATTGRPSLQAAILVFLIADIRGYTHFTQEHGDEAAARLTERFAELARGVAERWDGHLVEVRGDEILAVFASARQAVRAAHDLAARYADEAQTHPELPPGIGIGLDLGEAVPVEEGYRGAALNRAARLCSLAGPGEVLVSTGVVYVAPQVDGVRFVPRGQEQIKGFDVPIPILLAAPSAPDAAESSE